MGICWSNRQAQRLLEKDRVIKRLWVFILVIVFLAVTALAGALIGALTTDTIVEVAMGMGIGFAVGLAACTCIACLCLCVDECAEDEEQ